MYAVPRCSRLYTGDSAFFSPCLGWPSPKATTKSLTFLTGAVMCHRAQQAPNASAPPLLPSLSWLLTDQAPPLCVPPDSQMSHLGLPDFPPSKGSAKLGSIVLALLSRCAGTCAAHCEVLEHVKLLTDSHIHPVSRGAGYTMNVMVWFASSALLG